MNTNSTISSLAEYMEWVNIGVREAKVNGSDALFYRGHSDIKYTLSPTVYRKSSEHTSFRAVEHHLYEEMLRRDPIAFANDRTVLERLVRMQHHGLPTRLLDLTHSPLVALYFACENLSPETGEVLFFHRQRKVVLQPSDVHDVALAGIEHACDLSVVGSEVVKWLVKYFQDEGQWKTEHAEFNTAYQALLNGCVELLTRALGLDDLLEKVAVLKEVESNQIPSFVKTWKDHFDQAAAEDQSEQIRILNAHVALQKFSNRFYESKEKLIATLCEKMFIRNNEQTRELSSFLQQFTFFYFAFPPINNERIRRQQGAFVICPAGRTKHFSLDEHFESHRVQIRPESKSALLDDLLSLGISRSYIFPELNELAADAKLRFPAAAD